MKNLKVVKIIEKTTIWPNIEGYNVEIEVDGVPIRNTFMTKEEFNLRMFLQSQFTPDVVTKVWKLIEDYGQMKYEEGSLDTESSIESERDT